MLTQAKLKKILSYNPETGIFRWLVAIGPRALVGAEAGWKTAEGYRSVEIDRKAYRLHRLAFLYMTGKFPEDWTDHINGKKSDNRWTNLREATKAINMQNRRRANKNSVSGALGAHFNKRLNKYCAIIWHGKKQNHIGVYDTAAQAHDAYLTEKRRLHPGCTI